VAALASRWCGRTAGQLSSNAGAWQECAGEALHRVSRGSRELPPQAPEPAAPEVVARLPIPPGEIGAARTRIEEVLHVVGAAAAVI